MNYYVVSLIQLIIYSAFTYMEYLSGKDHHIFNILMFVIFFYLSFIIAKYFLKTINKSIAITLISLAGFYLIYEGLGLFI